MSDDPNQMPIPTDSTGGGGTGTIERKDSAPKSSDYYRAQGAAYRNDAASRHLDEHARLSGRREDSNNGK